MKKNSRTCQGNRVNSVVRLSRSMNSYHYTDISGKFGPVFLVWWGSGSQFRILRVILPADRVSREQELLSRFPGITRGSSSEAERYSGMITGFLSGEDVRFDPDVQDWSQCTGFQKKVLLYNRKIPRGTTATYRDIARAVGNENSCRAVGNALAGNPFPIVIPCHRVIRSDGTHGKYAGGEQMKRILLEQEGVILHG